jgi:hypothetical protein
MQYDWKDTMKNVLALCALAVLASTGMAGAKGKSYDISLDGYCNIYHTQITGNFVVVQDTPSCSGNFGVGMLATVKSDGKVALISLANTADPGAQLLLELSYPFANGGTFHLYQTTNGATYTDALDGTYSLHAAPDEGAKSAMPVTAALRR